MYLTIHGHMHVVRLFLVSVCKFCIAASDIYLQMRIPQGIQCIIRLFKVRVATTHGASRNKAPGHNLAPQRSLALQT